MIGHAREDNGLYLFMEARGTSRIKSQLLPAVLLEFIISLHK